MTPIFNFDASILLWLQNNVRHPILDPVMIFITHLGDKGLFWIALTLLMLCFRKTRRAGVTSAISMTIGLIVVNVILKNWVARIRPYELIEELELIIERQHDFSFPSGHATNALACAWVMFRLLDKKAGIPALEIGKKACGGQEPFEEKLTAALADVAVVDRPPRVEGRTMTMFLAEKR